MITIRRYLRLGVAAMAFASLGGCSEYLDRRDTLRRTTGNAVEANIVTHQIDPWPPHALVYSRTVDGEKSQRAIERYRNPAGGAAGSSTPAAAPLSARSGDATQPRFN